jgi:hypothetical protein
MLFENQYIIQDKIISIDNVAIVTPTSEVRGATKLLLIVGNEANEGLSLLVYIPRQIS